MQSRLLQFRPEGIYCVQGKFYIDPWMPVDKAIITHGHSDHARAGMNDYLCHHLTTPILKIRLGDISVQGIEYGETVDINGVKLSLHPAGHIIGAAQVRMEYKGRVAVVSGDYKVQHDGLTTPIEIVKCHEFVSESTFALPVYNWASVEEQNRQLRSWVQNNQAIGKTSVLIGYALGKAQRIMKALEGLGPLNVHYSIAKLNDAYEAAGVRLPDYHTVDLNTDLKTIENGILIVPPSLVDTNLLRKVPHRAEAICSGWMQVRGARRWRAADAGFAISDHADWNGLLQVIKGTQAEQVYVTHGQTAVFEKYLNEIGIPTKAVKTVFGEEEIQELS
ncbi:ligase-associated DNA damage response exonuclease [Polluticaenibacter yanchengensis]|uniref:Ligase-associated DNA damage response exonuclease n=1 Tax=Polluticaenibacter yanchengensis TaxID=3014562 RepID=A0ABT4UF80_9BACT|nr:ligase-associated DNA damage response exonuclease [Chitinophagaceae bacterium LY-5]